MQKLLGEHPDRPDLQVNGTQSATKFLAGVVVLPPRRAVGEPPGAFSVPFGENGRAAQQGGSGQRTATLSADLGSLATQALSLCR